MTSMRSSAAYQEQANVRTDTAQACARTMVQTSDDHALTSQFTSTCASRLAIASGDRRVTGLDTGPNLMLKCHPRKSHVIL